MGKHKHKRPENGYELTSFNLTKEDRAALTRLMMKQRMKMGEAIRYAIRYTEQRVGQESVGV